MDPDSGVNVNSGLWRSISERAPHESGLKISTGKVRGPPFLWGLQKDTHTDSRPRGDLNLVLAPERGQQTCGLWLPALPDTASSANLKPRFYPRRGLLPGRKTHGLWSFKV